MDILTMIKIENSEILNELSLSEMRDPVSPFRCEKLWVVVVVEGGL